MLEQCFKSALTENDWLPKLKEMIPSYGQSLIDNAELCRRVRAETAGRSASGKYLKQPIRKDANNADRLPAAFALTSHGPRCE